MATTMSWHPTTHADYDALVGTDVFSSDGKKVGTIRTIFHPDLDMPAARGQHWFLLDPGRLRDWFGGFDEVYLPESAIDAVGPDRVTLSLTKTQIKGQGWTTRPVEIDRFRRTGAPYAPATAAWDIHEGDAVFGSDGEKLGKVVAVQPGYLVAEKGFFFPTDYYIPLSAISSYEDGKVFLVVAKEAALSQGWEMAPTDLPTTGAFVGDAARVDAAYAGATTVAAGETIRVPVHAEELAATKRQRELGAVRVQKDVVTEERTIEVPLTEERARIARRAVDRPLAAGEAAFEEGVIEVPLRGEEVELQKRVRVAEEVEIGKEAVQRTETVGGTVRREEVRVHEDATGAVEPIP